MCFPYLGSFSIDGGAELDVDSRIQKGKVPYGMLAKIWFRNKISTKTKLQYEIHFSLWLYNIEDDSSYSE
jgi:hypothetical protein